MNQAARQAVVTSLDEKLLVRRLASIVALVAVAIWLGGLLALGAIVAPVIFSRVPLPASADAMTIVFRRFDLVAMTCASLLLLTEAVRAVARVPFGPIDQSRAALSVVVAVIAVFEATRVSPRIAELHAAGALRGYGVFGAELSRMHDLAEWCGKGAIFLLAAIVAVHVLALTPRPRPPPAAARAISE